MFVIGVGVILIEVVKVVDEFVKESSYIRVMDLFILKLIDKEVIIIYVKVVGGKILIVEDYYIEGKCVNIVFGSNIFVF